LNRRLVFSIAVVVAVLLAGGLLIAVEQGGTGSTTTTAAYEPPAVLVTGNSYVNPTLHLQLRLSVNASYAGGTHGNVAIEIKADEYNTLTIYNDVQAASLYSLGGLSLGSCPNPTYPFGVALYTGKYTSDNVSQATALQIYSPSAPCAVYGGSVTGYLFAPGSDSVAVLPSGSNATTTPLVADVTATAVYSSATLSSSAHLGPGTYTVAAGDEWGSVVTAHFTIGTGASTTTSGSFGTLGPQFAILSASLAAWPILAAGAARATSRTRTSPLGSTPGRAPGAP